jgi:hypothetical protein
LRATEGRPVSASIKLSLYRRLNVEQGAAVTLRYTQDARRAQEVRLAKTRLASLAFLAAVGGSMSLPPLLPHRRALIQQHSSARGSCGVSINSRQTLAAAILSSGRLRPGLDRTMNTPAMGIRPFFMSTNLLTIRT